MDNEQQFNDVKQFQEFLRDCQRDGESPKTLDEAIMVFKAYKQEVLDGVTAIYESMDDLKKGAEPIGADVAFARIRKKNGFQSSS